MSEKVSIATKPLVYSTFRYISNHVWNAIGEYVDNSIQSYETHISDLKPINPKNKLRVEINFDFENKKITIKDNAFGIDADNFERAFELANVPLDNKGLNEFGMGMKVSSIWLSNLWTVETTAYNEPVKKTVRFDLREVVANEETSLNVDVQPCDPKAHYTIITLEDLSPNSPTGRQLPTIKKHLASIYTKFIRENIVEIIVDGEVLQDTVLKPLVTPFYKTPDAKPITWKKEINFVAGNYKVKGFIGILERMSTNTDNGFLLFRRNKVIGTSYDTKFRPKTLCGEPGSPRYKRIYGELELEGFSVSFTKNSFTQDDDLDAFIEMLADSLKKDASFKIFEQAQKYTPTKTKKEKEDVGQHLVNNIVSGLNKPIIVNLPDESQAETKDSNENESQTSSSDNPAPQEIVETPENNPETPALPTESNGSTSIKPQEIPVTANGVSFKLTVGAENESNPTGLYNLFKIDDGHYRSDINLSNPFFERFAQMVSSEEDYRPISTIIKTMIVTDILLLKKGDSGGSRFRKTFNELFGIIDV